MYYIGTHVSPSTTSQPPMRHRLADGSRHRIALCGLGISVLVLLLAAGCADSTTTNDAARTFGIPTGYILPEGSTVNDDLYIAASTVTIAGTVNGDLFVISERLQLSGQVNGDVFAVASSASIRGEVSESLRIIGLDYTITGAIGADLIAVGRRVALKGKVGTDAITWTRELHAGGDIGGDLIGHKGRTTIVDATIHQDAEVESRRITVTADAFIADDLHYISPHPVTIQEGAQITGTTVKRYRPTTTGPTLTGLKTMVSIVGIALFAAYAIWSVWSSSIHLDSVSQLKRKPLRCLVYGLIHTTVAFSPAMAVVGMFLRGPPIAAGRAVGAAVIIGTLFLLPYLTLFTVRSLVPVLTYFGERFWDYVGRTPASPELAVGVAAVPFAILVLATRPVGYFLLLATIAAGAGSRWCTLRAGGRTPDECRDHPFQRAEEPYTT